MKNPYETLGVGKDASQAEIKKAFRAKSRAAHPDREGGNAAAQSEINVAYKLLSSPEKRARYDSMGEQGATLPTLDEISRARICFHAMKCIHECPIEVDLVMSICSNLQAERSGCLKKLRELESSRAKVERALKKLKGPPDNFLAYSLQDGIRQHDEVISRTQHDLKVFDRALELLKDFSWEHMANQVTIGRAEIGVQW